MSEERRSAPWLLVVGLPIGFLGSLAGIGGGLFAGPLLHFLFRFDLRRATGTALVLVLATTLAATVTEALQADSALQPKIVGVLALGIVVGAVLGFVFSERMPERTLRALFTVVLLYAGARVFLSGAAAEGGLAGFEPGGAQWVTVALVGLGGGFAAPVLGVGGGLVMVPGLYLGLEGLGFDAARACSLAGGCFASLISLALKHRAGRVSWPHGGLLATGALVGAAAGVLAKDASPGLLELGRMVLAVVLVFVALRFARSFLTR
ncbi:MAG: sulfite exporter TauE/SafE family protein [Deltaproteobacteria bacterium]|nr:sulfite exporter TauE/SafE family protein [Deltaproteobacteria bacterium]